MAIIIQKDLKVYGNTIEKLSLNNDDNIASFTGANHNSNWFKFKQENPSQTGPDDRKNVKTMVPFKYLTNFWKNLEMLLINCEINLSLNWSAGVLYHLIPLQIKK